MEVGPILFGALTVYRERGTYLRRIEQYELAKAAYDEALHYNSEDPRTLMGRSQVCAAVGKSLEAYQNAEQALQLEPNNMTALTYQGQALYAMGNFERSIVMNSRGIRTRKQPPYFSEGINQGIETLQDCIGVYAGNVMMDFLPLIKELELNTDSDQNKKVTHVSRIPKPESIVKLTSHEARNIETLSRVLSMKYLGPMAYDKFFLQALKKNTDIVSANAKGTKQMQEIIEVCLQSLIDRQDMLRTQRPYYTIKLAEKAESRRQNKFKLQILEREREIGARMAEAMIRKIDISLYEQRIMDLISRAERMQKFLDGKTHRTLPDKDYYTDRLYKAVGEGYLAQHRLSYKLSKRGNRRRIAYLMGLTKGRPRSYDSVVANYPYRVRNLRDATEKIQKSIDICENAMMRCWLYYEMADLLMKQKSYTLARFNAKRCQREAEEIDNTAWWLNGCFLLIKGDMQLGNFNEMRLRVAEAYEWTCKLYAPENLQNFLATCLEMASDTIVQEQSDAVALREKHILDGMDPREQVNMGELFRRMSAVPAGRRFSLVPHRFDTGADKDRPERRARRQLGLTVVPGPLQVIRKPPSSGIPGLQKFDL